MCCYIKTDTGRSQSGAFSTLFRRGSCCSKSGEHSTLNRRGSCCSDFLTANDDCIYNRLTPSICPSVRHW